MEATQSGTLIPYYDFTPNGTLSLCFQFVTENQVAQKFCRIDIAKFDTRTLRCFQTDLDDFSSLSSTEFLIQALYSSFVKGLGLPGQESYETTTQLLAPKEVEFIGLYRLWEFAPECMIEYNSQVYSEAIHQNLTTARESDAELSNEADQMFRDLRIQIDENYLSVLLESKHKEHKLDKIEKDFKERFALLLAFTKLLSKVENKILYGMMERYFDITPQLLGEELIQPTIALTEHKMLSPVSEEMIQLFISELKYLPSKRVVRLNNQLQDIVEIEALVSSSNLRGTFVPVSKGNFSPNISHPPVNTTCVGFPNLINSCYINASLQVLLASSFSKMIKGVSSDNLSNGMIRHVKHLQDFISKRHTGGIRESLLAIRESLFAPSPDRHGEFAEGLYEQKDAGAFISALFSNFGYQFRIEERRSGLDTISGKQISRQQGQAHNLLYIPFIRSTHKFTDLIHEYFNETVSANEGVWKAEEVGQTYNIPNSTIVRRFLGSMPELLVFQLMRYGMNPWRSDQSIENSSSSISKIDQVIDMPEDGIIDLSSYHNERKSQKELYRLRGCINHNGPDTESGHYTAYIREGERWLYVNDDLILCEVSFEDVKKAQHYIYLFEKVN